MTRKLGMKKIFIPLEIDNENNEGPVPVFITPDYDTNKEKCLIIIQGTGDIRAGYHFDL